MPTVAPYGSWTSPITPEVITSSSVSVGEVWVESSASDAAVWWSEMRPEEAGRVQLVRRGGDGVCVDVLPEGFAARTRVHEYGGGAWWLDGGTVYFANWDDQRLYRMDRARTVPVALTRPPLHPGGLRYADGRTLVDERWLVCVRESHEHGDEVINELVAVPTGGGDAVALGTASDFVSNPRPSPDGRWLAWLEWDHPSMPWDATRLWVASLEVDDHDVALVDAVVVAGGDDEAVTQPEWSPAGILHFLSDRSGWSNLHCFATAGRPQADDHGAAIVPMDAEVGTPPWVFGMSRYTFLDDGGSRIAAVASTRGVDDLRLLERDGSGWSERSAARERLDGGATSGDPERHDGLEQPEVPDHPADIDTTAWSCLKRRGDAVVAIAASFASEPAVVAYRPSNDVGGRWDLEMVRRGRDLGLAADWWSVPRHVTFPTGPADGAGDEPGRGLAPRSAENEVPDVAHGLFYPPTNPDHRGPEGTQPPLLVAIHGGPTAMARSQRQLGIQFWTSRGFGVLDVNYRGSTGYGRSYRRALDGAWGVVDVQDCAAGAAHLAAEGVVDGSRLAIHGGSAGGFTTLMALITTDRFAAGTSSYGVTDLEALARDTHKFESRYLDRLVGPYPARRDLYVERSPVHHLDRLDVPVLLLQGVDDPIVPLSQAELMVDALKRRGVPFAFLAFEGEQHGFRNAATIRRALEAELAFYAHVLEFALTDEVAPLEIENMAPPPPAGSSRAGASPTGNRP